MLERLPPLAPDSSPPPVLVPPPRLRIAGLRSHTAAPLPQLRETNMANSVSWTPSLPAEPVPQLRIDPQRRPPKKHVAGCAPSCRNLCPAFHPRANCRVGIVHRHAREEIAIAVLNFAFGAYHRHRAVERPRRIAVQFDRRILPHTQQANVRSVDGHI